MKSFAIVFDHPYYSITDKNGDFVLTDVPEGTYTLKIWHEKLKSETEDIIIKLNKNETKEIQIKLQ